MIEMVVRLSFEWDNFMIEWAQIILHESNHAFLSGRNYLDAVNDINGIQQICNPF